MLISAAAPAATSDVGEGLDRTSDGVVVVRSLTDSAESSELSPMPILITEHEVVFGTLAAVSLPRTKTTRRLTDATRVVVAKLRRIFPTSMARPRPARRHYPPRSNSYLEHALMAREMHRL